MDVYNKNYQVQNFDTDGYKVRELHPDAVTLQQKEPPQGEEVQTWRGPFSNTANG